MFHTAAMRSRALMSGSCGCGSSGSQKKTNTVRTSRTEPRSITTVLPATFELLQDVAELPSTSAEHGKEALCTEEHVTDEEGIAIGTSAEIW